MSKTMGAAQQGMSRRSFMQGAVCAGVGAAAMGALSATQAFADESAEEKAEAEEEAEEAEEAEGEAETESEELTWDLETDVVVCGCGCGGVAAAVAAADGGAEVVVVEKKSWLGGQMRRSGGGVAAAGSQVQEALGVEDTADAYYEYWMASQNDMCDADLVRAICDGSAGIIDWLIDDLGGQPVDEWDFDADSGDGLTYSAGPGLNIGTDPSAFEELGMDPVARCHWFTPNYDDPILDDEDIVTWTSPGGTALWAIFENAFEERGIEPLTETSLVSLVTEPGSDEVLGIVASQGEEEIRIKARKGVVVATGNFTSNHEMFQNYTMYDYVASDDLAGNGILDQYDDNDGAGITAVLALGGELVYPMAAVTVNEDGTATGNSIMAGGMRVSPNAEALNVFGEAIPRLYLAGITTGGRYMVTYPNCGSSLLSGFYLGKTAGEQIAALDSWEE